MFTVKDKQLTPAGKLDTGNPKSLPSAVVFVAAVFVGGKTALLARGRDNMVSELHIDGTAVTIGLRAEAVAFSRDGRTVLVQSMQDREIEVFRWNGKTLTAGKSLPIPGAGPESFATAW